MKCSDIIKLLSDGSNLKAKEIAALLGTDTTTVNRCLHAEKNKIYFQDEFFRWSLIRNLPDSVVDNNQTGKKVNSFPDFSQKQFIESPSDNIRFLAPAGSGKTLSLIYKCKYIYDKAIGTKPHFLIITFTNSAKTSLENKINEDRSLSYLSSFINIQTLNSWGITLLKKVDPAFKGSSSFDDNYLIKHFSGCLKPLCKEYEEIDKCLENKYVGAKKKLIEIIDKFKTLGFDHTEHSNLKEFSNHFRFLVGEADVNFFKSIFEDLKSIELDVEFDELYLFNRIYKFVESAINVLYLENAFTFEDQKYWAYRYIRDNRSSKELKAMKIDYLFVDEFQDINPLDVKLLSKIAEHFESKVILVGDDDQAIFQWRGATPFFILKPEHHFRKSFETIKLKVNYRCPKNITEHATKLIRHNTNRVDKEMVSSNDYQADIMLIQGQNPKSKYDRVISTIKKKIENKEDVCLIGRRRAHLLPYQVLLANMKIVFDVDEDLNIFSSKEFTEFEELVKRCDSRSQDSNDLVGFYIRCMNKIKQYGLSKDVQNQIKEYLGNQKYKSIIEITEKLSNSGIIVKDQTINNFSNIIKNLYILNNVADKINYIKLHFKIYSKKKIVNEPVFLAGPPLVELADLAQFYGDNINLYFNDLHNSVNFVKENKKNKEDVYVFLNTAQRAKGKDFDVVMILEASQDNWFRNLDEVSGLEEARRLFYVALTRVKKSLYFVLGEGELVTFVEEAGWIFE